MSLITMTLIITTSLARVEASGSLLERLLMELLESLASPVLMETLVLLETRYS